MIEMYVIHNKADQHFGTEERKLTKWHFAFRTAIVLFMDGIS